MIRLAYAPDLLEEAVLLAEGKAPVAEARAFRRERDELYEIVDADAREAEFRLLHLRWFARFGLDRPIDELVRARADIAGRIELGRVLRALIRRDEGADLVDQILPGNSGPMPMLVLRLRPTTLLAPDALRALLHHELTHVADMLEPAFGYERTPPASEDGPLGDNLLRDRYRVLWDATIDGRLARAGLANGAARDARWQEFAVTFPMLGDGCPSAFDRWFNEMQPTHVELVAFATAPSLATKLRRLKNSLV